MFNCRFDLGSSTISHLVAGVTNQYSTREMLHEVRDHFRPLLLEDLADLILLCWCVFCLLLCSCVQIRSFFDSLTEEAGSQMRCIQQSYETIEDNIRWMDRNLPLLQAWLNKHGSRNHHQELWGGVKGSQKPKQKQVDDGISIFLLDEKGFTWCIFFERELKYEN